MSDTDTVLDVETEDITETATATRPFKVVSHKPGLAAVWSPFGGTQDIGVSVDPATAATTLWWISQDWAVQVLRANIALPQLLAPPAGWLAGLGEKWLHRRSGTLRKRDIPAFYAKHPELVGEHPQVVLAVPGEHTELLNPRIVPAAELAEGRMPPGYDRMPEDMLLQLDQMLPCVVEVRVWVADGQPSAACPYRIGMVGWDSSLFLEMRLNADGQRLTQLAIDHARALAAEVDAPPGYAIDLGVTIDGTVTVLRAWPAWAAEPLDADPTGVFTALAAAHDFDGTAERWRWDPDLTAYDRSLYVDAADEDPDNLPESPTENPDQEDPTDA